MLRNTFRETFAQFVYDSKWNKELNELIEEGLALIGAEKHLALFQENAKKIRLMSNIKLDKFLKGKLEGVNPIRDMLINDTFFELDENLTQLNADFLKSHPIPKCFPWTKCSKFWKNLWVTRLRGNRVFCDF